MKKTIEEQVMQRVERHGRENCSIVIVDNAFRALTNRSHEMPVNWFLNLHIDETCKLQYHALESIKTTHKRGGKKVITVTLKLNENELPW